MIGKRSFFSRSLLRAPSVLAISALAFCPIVLLAQGGRGAPQAPRTGRSAAPTDLTGYWVSVVTEDWLYRMVTPAKGDFSAIPLNAEGRKIGEAWDPAKDEADGEQCKAYGAPGIMRLPGRVHITWQDDDTLKVEKDSGTQTRLFHFGAAGNFPGGDWQGVSTAAWDVAEGARGPVPGGGLKVITTKIRPGYLRKNGPPYSANTVVTEFYDRLNETNGDTWLIVETIVDDPMYLNRPFITSTNFKKQADATGWNPTPCTAR
jgi:hypothetical protein